MIMQCYKCGREPIENNLNMIAVDPPRTPNRRWVCTECANIDEKASVSEDIKELCAIINPNFLSERR